MKTPAEQIAAEANAYAYSVCKSLNVEVTGNPRLDKFNPVFNRAYFSEYNRLIDSYIARNA